MACRPPRYGRPMTANSCPICGKAGVVDVIATAKLRGLGPVSWPMRLCEEHAELLQGYFVELRFPDGRVIQHPENGLNL